MYNAKKHENLSAMTTPEVNLKSSDKNLEAMRNFSEQYAKRTGTFFCSELSVTAVVIEGLAKHKDDLGAPLCPCRHYEDKEAEVNAAFWNVKNVTVCCFSPLIMILLVINKKYPWKLLKKFGIVWDE
jgi:ferredoxin-thioredoxin reductase catalytic chain